MRWCVYALTVALALLSGCQVPHLTTVTVSKGFSVEDYPSIAVLSFSSPKTETIGQVFWGQIAIENAGATVANQFAAELMEHTSHRVIERNQLNRVLAELDLTQADLVEQARFAEVGQILGLNALVIGDVHDLRNAGGGPFCTSYASFSARCVDVNTAEILWMASGDRSVGYHYDPVTLCRSMVTDAVAQIRRILDKRKQYRGSENAL